MEVSTRASRVIAAPPEKVYDFATDPDVFHTIFPGNLLVPAVEKVSLAEPGEAAVGRLRYVDNSDGSRITEMILALERPSRHRYRLVEGFQPPFSWMVKTAEGDWLFAPVEGGTRVTWIYSFQLRSALAAPVTLPIVKLFFRRAMEACLECMDRAVT